MKRRGSSEPKAGCGRKPLREKFPQLTPKVDAIVQRNGFKAHVRRRFDWGTSCGTNLNKLQKEVIETVEGLDSVSKSTLRRLMEPPNKKFKAAKLYCGEIKAKLQPKCNDQEWTIPMPITTRAV